MESSEFARAVVEMLQSEKETFEEMIANEDWEGIEEEAFQYAQSAE